MTSHRRRYDVILAPYAHGEASLVTSTLDLFTSLNLKLKIEAQPRYLESPFALIIIMSIGESFCSLLNSTEKVKKLTHSGLIYLPIKLKLNFN